MEDLYKFPVSFKWKYTYYLLSLTRKHTLYFLRFAIGFVESMSYQGRGSAVVAAAVAVVCLLLVLNFEVAEAANYKVGAASGWTFNAVGWPRGKRFRAGDTLVFSYSPKAHNLVVVNKAGYDSCKAPANAKVYSSGNDKIKLAKGQNFFICSFVGHCESGMKIAVTAT